MASGPEGRPPAPPPPRRSAARGGGGAAALAAGIISLAAVTSGGGGMGTAVLPSPPAARAEVMEATASAGSVLDPPMTSVATFTKGSALDAAEAAMAAADAAIAAAEAAATAADAATAAADAAMAAAASVPMAAHRAEVGIPPIAAPSVAAPEPTAVSAPSADALEPSAVAAPTSAAFKRTEVAVPAAVPAAAPATAESVDSRAPDDFSSAPTSVAPAVATAPAPTPPPLDKEHALLDEVWALIDRYYLTLRDAPAWADQRRKAASTPLGGSRTATYAAARRMLKTLGDPYTRLLTPDGMAALSKYDVTGLGLMLLPTKGGGGDAGVAAPSPVAATAAANGSTAASGSSSSGGGDASAAPSRLYVAAPPPKDSPAGLAGLRRSDVIMTIDGVSTANMSAWEAATRMQGPAEGLLNVSYARPPAVVPVATPPLGTKTSAAASPADLVSSAPAPPPPTRPRPPCR